MGMKFSASLMAHMLIELHRELSSHLSALVKAEPDIVISYKAFVLILPICTYLNPHVFIFNFCMDYSFLLLETSTLRPYA